MGSIFQSATLPRFSLARWLVAPGRLVDNTISAHLASGLHTSIPIFLGGVINSIVIAAIAVARHPTDLFVVWLATEVLLGVTRLAVLVAGRRAQKIGKQPSNALPAILSCCWAASVGYGAFISMASEDWVLATIVCLSAAAMVSGICTRNFGTPRLACVMMMLSLMPCALAAIVASEPVLLVIAIQIPFGMAAVASGVFKLNLMLVDRMVAQQALEASEAFNRSILESSPDYTLLLDEQSRIVFLQQSANRASRARGHHRRRLA